MPAWSRRTVSAAWTSRSNRRRFRRRPRFTVGCSGVEINERLECLDKDDKPIPGLYAIGNLAGNFYGSVDYPLDIFGLNLGHNYTEGYVVAEELAKL